MEPGQEVQILRPDEQTRAKVDAMLSSPAIEPAKLPAGRIGKETLQEIAQENVGIAFNRITQIASTGSEKQALAAANAILDRAHGKVSGDNTQVNVQINFSHASDDEILRRYYERMKDATTSTD